LPLTLKQGARIQDPLIENAFEFRWNFRQIKIGIQIMRRFFVIQLQTLTIWQINVLEDRRATFRRPSTSREYVDIEISIEGYAGSSLLGNSDCTGSPQRVHRHSAASRISHHN